MGVFSSKYKTNVATTVTRVLDDDAIPNSIRTGALKSIIARDEQLIENSLEELAAGMGVRCHRMFSHAKKPVGGYPVGLPKSTFTREQDGEAVVKAAVEAQVGGPIVVEYYHFGAFNNLHFGWDKLVDLHDYDTETNQLGLLSIEKGRPVFLKDITVVVADATLIEMSNGSLEQWGLPATAGPAPDRPAQTWETGALRQGTPFKVDDSVTSDYLKVDYVWTTVAGVLQYGSFNITVAGQDDTVEYHHMKYTVGGVPGYFMYRAGAGTYPMIDALYNVNYEGLGTYFPWIYFRYNKVSMMEDETTEEYKSAKKLMNYLNMSFKDVGAAMHENPDIGDVEQAMMMMAVPANTSNQAEMRYLFDYFKALHIAGGNDMDPPVKPVNAGITSNLWNMIDAGINNTSSIIQDSRFRLGLSYRNIFRQRISGTVAAVGKYTSGNGREVITLSGSNISNGAPRDFNSEVSYHFYRKQLTETMYEEVRVINLKSVYHIFGEFTVTADDEDEILLIPVDQQISKLYPLNVREVLYSRSLHYIFNSRVVTKIKWYQRGAFKILIIVIMIIITIVTKGATWQALAASVAAGVITLQAFLMIILTAIIKQLVIAYAIKLFVKAVGTKIALIVAIVAVIYGFGSSIQSGSIEGAPWASELMDLSSSIVRQLNVQVQDDFNALMQEQEDFNLLVSKEEAKLKKAEDLLNNDLRVSPLIIFGETAQEYYQRTVHSGNIGPIGLDAISSYVDVALTLPTLTESLGEA